MRNFFLSTRVIVTLSLLLLYSNSFSSQLTSLRIKDSIYCKIISNRKYIPDFILGENLICYSQGINDKELYFDFTCYNKRTGVKKWGIESLYLPYILKIFNYDNYLFVINDHSIIKININTGEYQVTDFTKTYKSFLFNEGILEFEDSVICGVEINGICKIVYIDLTKVTITKTISVNVEEVNSIQLDDEYLYYTNSARLYVYDLHTSESEELLYFYTENTNKVYSTNFFSGGYFIVESDKYLKCYSTELRKTLWSKENIYSKDFVTESIFRASDKHLLRISRTLGESIKDTYSNGSLIQCYNIKSGEIVSENRDIHYYLYEIRCSNILNDTVYLINKNIYYVLDLLKGEVIYCKYLQNEYNFIINESNIEKLFSAFKVDNKTFIIVYVPALITASIKIYPQTKKSTCKEIDNLTIKIISGTTFVSIRSFIEAFGGNVIWNQKTKKIITSLIIPGSEKTFFEHRKAYQLKENIVEFTINSNKAIINGETKILAPHDTKITPIVEEGIAMAPLRFLAESLGISVDWHSEKNEITLTYSP